SLYKKQPIGTAWHPMGLEADLTYCVTADVAPVLPIYKNGDLVRAN
ncbi:MAG: hypothetical protein RL544_1769, partial [Bacteroidota bacterium]